MEFYTLQEKELATNFTDSTDKINHLWNLCNLWRKFFFLKDIGSVDVFQRKGAKGQRRQEKQRKAGLPGMRRTGKRGVAWYFLLCAFAPLRLCVKFLNVNTA